MSTWTDERRNEAIRLYREGVSASLIAKKLGGTTRNAVIGIVYRAGEQRSAEAGNVAARINRGQALQAGRRPKAPPVARAPNQNAGLNFGNRKPAAPVVKPDPYLGRALEKKLAAAAARPADQTLPPEPPGPSDVVPFEQLRALNCRWPIGDPSNEGFGFCGRRKQPDSSYCPDHHKRAHQPLPPRAPKSGNELARSLRRYSAC